MKRIAYWLKNPDYVQILLAFCKTDGFAGFELSPGTDMNGNCVFYVTDVESEIDRTLPSGVPRGLISSVNHAGTPYFIMNENIGATNFRALLDEIHHGGGLWNLVEGLKLASSVREYYFSNNIHDVERFVCLATEDLIHYCDFSGLEKIRVGFSEMLTNAIEHGNLNITGKEKHASVEDGTFQELLRERMNNCQYADRKVYCKVSAYPGEVRIIIRDEGCGFNISDLPSPHDADQMMKLHGRGILIAKVYFDEVTYSMTGNEVTLVKNF